MIKSYLCFIAYFKFVMLSNYLYISYKDEVDADTNELYRFCELFESNLKQLKAFFNITNLEKDFISEELRTEAKKLIYETVDRMEILFERRKTYLIAKTDYYNKMLQAGKIKLEDMDEYKEQEKRTKSMIFQFDICKETIKTCARNYILPLASKDCSLKHIE